MKMKYAGYEAEIDVVDNKLKDALRVSEILKGFKRKRIKVKIETKRLNINDDENNKPFDAVIFNISLPKKKADSMARAIPFNFFTYSGKHAICQSIPVTADGSYDGSGTITLIYPLEYTINDLLRDLGMIKLLDIRSEKFHPLSTLDNYDEAWESILTNDYELGACTISYITNPEDLIFDDFMPDEIFRMIVRKYSYQKERIV